MSTVTKYWDKYRERHKAENPENLIDKQSYISFLEVQLERVSQAVLLTQNFNERIENVQSQLNSAEEKIINLTRLVKLQQNYAETQEEEISSLKARLEVLDSGGGYYGIEEPKNKDRSHHVEEEISELEEKLKIVLQRTENSEDQRNKAYEKFIKDVNSALKATEEKVMSYLTHAINNTEFRKSSIKKNFEGKTEDMDQGLEEELNELQMKSERNKEIRGLMSFGTEGDLPELKRIWAKLEEFGNFKDCIEKIVMEKDTEIKEATEMVWASERTCNRLAEDCTSKISECERALKDLEQFLVATAKEIKKIEIAQGIRPIDTDEIEKNITEKMTETVNNIGDLVKKYFTSQQDLQKEVKVLASKVYGKSSVPPISPKFKSPIRKTEVPEKPPISPLTKTLQELETSLNQSKHKRSISSDAEKRNKDDDSHELKHKSRSKSPKPKLSKKIKSISSLTPDRKRSKSSSKSRSRSRSRSNSKSRTKSISELSPKSTKKSLAMESSIRQKIVEMKAKEDEEEQKISQKTIKRHSKLDKKKKKLEKLEKIYQKLSARDLK